MFDLFVPFVAKLIHASPSFTFLFYSNIYKK